MSTRPFDRMVLNPRERPLSGDHNQQASNVERSLMKFILDLAKEWANPIAAGASFLADGFKVVADGPPDLFVQVTSGLGFYNDAADEPTMIGGLVGVDDLSSIKPLPLSANQIFAVPAPDPVNPRVDIIEVKTDRRLEQPDTRDILNVATGQFTATPGQNKVLAYYLDGRVGTVAFNQQSITGIGYKTGNPGAGVPATSAGYTKICEIAVGAAVGSINNGNITDRRQFLFPLQTLINTLAAALIAPVQADLDDLEAAVVAPVFFSTDASPAGGPPVTTIYGPGFMKFADTGAAVSQPMPACVLKNFRIVAATGPAGGTVTFTVLKNGVPTALTFIMGIGVTVASDLAHSVAFAAGDTLSIQSVTNAGQTSGPKDGVRFSVEVHPAEAV